MASPSAILARRPDLSIGDWLIQPSLGTATRDGDSVHLEPKTMDVLLCLAERRGEVVSKEEILAAVWPKIFVSEHVLTHAIWQLRQVFADADFIQTVPRRGYRLAAEVRPGAAHIQSLAVLPLKDLSGMAGQEYLADGVTEALIAALAQIGALRVISRTSSMLYKEASKPLRQIAQELGVDAVVEGSVARMGDRVRVTAQLIHGATDQHVWAQSYERDLGDVLSLQDEIARGIAREVEVSLTSEEHTRLTRVRTSNREAQAAYMKGRYSHYRLSESGLRQAIAYMQEAISLDPTFALAYIGMADSIAVLASPIAAALAPAEANDIMRPAVLRALELDPELADAHFLQGWMKVYYEWDWGGARAAFNRAIALNPNCALAYAGLGTLEEALGDREEAIRFWQHTGELDPLSLMCNTLLGWTLVLAGRNSEAVTHLQEVVRLEPNYWFSQEVLALALLGLGRNDEAFAAAASAIRLCPEPFPRGVFGYVCGRSGRSQEAYRIFSELEQTSQHRYVAPNLLALVLAGVEEFDRALVYVQKAYEARDSSMIWIKSFPTLWGTDLDRNPIYGRLVREMGFPE